MNEILLMIFTVVTGNRILGYMALNLDPFKAINQTCSIKSRSLELREWLLAMLLNRVGSLTLIWDHLFSDISNQKWQHEWDEHPKLCVA